MKEEPSYEDIGRILSCRHRWDDWRTSRAGGRPYGRGFTASAWRRECAECGLGQYVGTLKGSGPPPNTTCSRCGWLEGVSARSYRWPGGMEWPSGLGHCFHGRADLDVTIQHGQDGCAVRVVCQLCGTPAAWRIPQRQAQV